MELSVRKSEAERLAAELACKTGETKTDAVIQDLREKLARVHRKLPKRRLADALDEIALHCAQLPILDARRPDEILGHDDGGLPR